MLIFPPLIEVLTFGFDGMGRFYWKCWKNLLIIFFGFVALIFGTYSSVLDLINQETDV